MPRRRGERGLFARLARAVGLALLTLLAVIVAALAFFPFERLAPALASRIEAETRVATTIEAMGVRFSWRGPELSARGIALKYPTGERLALDSLRIAPARPLSWLRGEPAAHISMSAPFGAFEGVASSERVSGNLARFDLSALPLKWFGENGSPLAGPVDAELDLARLAQQWSGSVKLSGRDGSIAPPGSPVAIPYETLASTLRLDEIGTLHIDSLTVEGPLVSASARGAIAAGYAGPATGAVAIEAEIARFDPALQPALAAYGIALDASGAGHVQLSGTPDAIEVR